MFELAKEMVEHSIGVRRQALSIFLYAATSLNSMPLVASERTAALMHEHKQAHWGADGALLLEHCKKYTLNPHLYLLRSEFTVDMCLPSSQECAMAEYTGDLSSTKTIFRRSIAAMHAYVKAKPP